MKPSFVLGLLLLLGGLSTGSALAVPPDWIGTYVYSDPAGRTAGGSGPAAFVDYRLTVEAQVCRLVVQGLQTTEDIKCEATVDGDKLNVRFVSYSDGKVENAYGVKLYQGDELLFSLTNGPQGLTTIWQGYNYKPKDATNGFYFKKIEQ
jgi:hypothetical protein